ncbi:MAG: hypothetical protein P1V51_11735 [Deltaproteobacteria bacterium]|nr:hypothetical protein [Deltaproteobacteria bacterium]
MTDVMGVVNFVGRAVDDLVTGLTGSEVLGDAAGLVVNMATGNYIGAIEEGMQLIDDLQQQANHPAEACPTYEEAQAEVEVEVTVRQGEPSPFSETARVAESAAREAAAELESRFDRMPAVDVDVTVQPRGGVEVDVEVEVRTGWSEPTGAASGARESLAAKLGAILNDPSLSLEDKIALIFGELLGGLDGEIEGKMDALHDKQAAKERSESGAKGKPAKGGEASAADISRLSSELQILMQRRSQMQSLLSNILGMSHQSAMQTIANIR